MRVIARYHHAMRVDLIPGLLLPASSTKKPESIPDALGLD